MRIWAQVGDWPMLYELGYGTVTSNAEVAQKLRDIADAYEEMDQAGQLPPLGWST